MNDPLNGRTLPGPRPISRAACLGVFVVSGAILALAGCQSRPATNGSGAVKATYDEQNGRLRQITYDSNKDGRPDMWGYFDASQLQRLEIDKDGDGKVDRWEFYGPDRKLLKVGTSAANTAKPDTWYYQDASGRLARIEKAAANGAIRRTEFYEAGVLARAEADTDGDGKVDTWETYEGGHLAAVATDSNHNGTPTDTVYYAADGSIRPAAPASAGSTPAGAAGAAVKR